MSFELLTCVCFGNPLDWTTVAITACIQFPPREGCMGRNGLNSTQIRRVFVSSSLTSCHAFAAVSGMRVWGCAALMMGLRNGSPLPSLLSALTLLPCVRQQLRDAALFNIGGSHWGHPAVFHGFQFFVFPPHVNTQLSNICRGCRVPSPHLGALWCKHL